MSESDKKKTSIEERHWVRRGSKDLIKTKYFRLRDDELLAPDGRIYPHYYVLDFLDWVNVVALTKSGEIILIKQYRHGIEKVSWEIPGGTTDPHSTEKPEEAAARELIEETGYAPREVKLLGVQDPNPALQSNRMWSYLALGCEKISDQKLDPFEDIDVVIVPVEEAYRKIREGEIRHSMVIAALYLAESHISKPEILGTRAPGGGVLPE